MNTGSSRSLIARIIRRLLSYSGQLPAEKTGGLIDHLEPRVLLDALPFPMGIAPGFNASQNISVLSDVDTYLFSTLRTDNVAFSLNYAAGPQLRFRVLTDEAVPVLLGNSSGGATTQGLTLNNLAPGSYKVEVFSNLGTGAYTLSTSPGAGSSTRVFYVNDGSQAGDTYATAPGNNTNNGQTPATPVDSVQRILSLHDLGPNDLVLVDVGTYGSSGASASTINLTAADEGAIFAGSPGGSGSQFVYGSTRFQLTDVDNTRFHNLRFTDSAVTSFSISPGVANPSVGNSFTNNVFSYSSSGGSGISSTNGGNDLISGNVFINVSNAIYYSGTYPTAGQSIRILGNTFATGQQAIYVGSTNAEALIDGNTITSFSTGIDFSAYSGANVVITNNTLTSITSVGIRTNSNATIHNNSLSLGAGATGIYSRDSISVLLTRNTISGGLIGIDGTGIIGPATWTAIGNAQGDENRISGAATGIRARGNAVVRFNRLTNNITGIANDLNYTSTLTINNNILSGNTGQGILITGSSIASTAILNNTIDTASGDGVRLSNSARNVTLRNNIIWTRNGYCINVDTNSQVGFSSDFNNLYTSAAGMIARWQKNFTDLFDWQVEADFDANSIGYTAVAPALDNPNFVNAGTGDFRLTPSGSTSINAGDPASAFDQEPSLGQGRINLGAYGNTSQAELGASSYIDIVYPNYYTDLEVAKSHTVRWRSHNLTGNVRIDLGRVGTGIINTLTTLPVADGVFAWSPSAYGISGSSTARYYVVITSIAAPAVSDQSRENFSIPTSGGLYYVDDASNTLDEYTPGAIGNNRNTGRTASDPKANLLPVLKNYDLGPGDTVTIDTGDYIHVRNVILSGAVNVGDDEGLSLTGPTDPARVARIDRANPFAGSSAIDIIDGDFVDIRRLTLVGGQYGLWIRNNSTNFSGGTLSFLNNSADGLRIDSDSPVFGSLANLTATGNGSTGISISNASNLTLTNVNASSNISYGVYITGSSNVTLSGGTISNNVSNGVNLSLSSGSGLIENFSISGNGTGITASNSSTSTLNITNNTIFNNTSIGVLAYYNVIIQNNTIYGHSGTGDVGMYLYYNASARDNTIHSNTSGIYVTSSNSIITGNRLYNNSLHAITLDAYSGGSRLDFNIIYNNGIGLRINTYNNTSTTVITNNLIYLNSDAAIEVLSNNSPLSIYNNTIHQPTGDGIRVLSSSRSVAIKNNIITVDAGSAITVAPDSQTDFASDFNLFYVTGTGAVGSWQGAVRTSLLLWQSAAFSDTNSREANPLFVDIDGADNLLGFVAGINRGNDDNFALQSTSPGIDAGDLNSFYLSEPVNSGGRINLGHHGNTPSATASPAVLTQVIAPNNGRPVEATRVSNVSFRAWGLSTRNTVALISAGTSSRIDTFLPGAQYLRSGYVTTSPSTNPINLAGVTDPAPQAVYQSHAYGSNPTPIRYVLPVPNGTYTLRLHFAETQSIPIGQRVMDVLVNGVVRQANYDIRAAAGGLDRAVVLEISVTAAGGAGVDLQIQRANVTTYDPMVSGIELLAAAGGVASPNVNLALSRDSGGTFAPIASNIPLDRFGRGSYAWTPAVGDITVARTALVSATSSINPSITDVSDDLFQITPRINIYYINDTSLVGDVFTTAIGNDANDGLDPSRPMLSIRALLERYDLDPGSTIRVDTGVYNLTTDLIITADDSGTRIEGPAYAPGSAPLAQLNRGNTSSGSDVVEVSASGITLANLRLYGGNIGINANDADDLTITGALIDSNSQYGVEGDSSSQRISILSSVIDGQVGRYIVAPYDAQAVLTSVNSIRWTPGQLGFANLGVNQFAATGSALNLNVANSWTSVSLPFSFPFFSTSYSYVYISSEGYIGWNSGAMTMSANSLAGLRTNQIIAPLWDNLRTDSPGDNVFFDTTVANQATIRWNATREDAGGGDVNFSVTLFSDGRVQFNYGAGNTNLTPTVGLSAGSSGVSYGVYLQGPSALLASNTINYHGQTGIYTTGTDATITGNTLIGNPTGIYTSGTDTSITSNTITGGTTGVTASNSTGSSPTLISGNTVSLATSYGIIGYYSGVAIANNTLFDNSTGVYLYYGASATGNTIYSNTDGIVTSYSASRIINNRIFDNTRHGIDISSYSGGVLVEGNQIYSNVNGIRVSSGAGFSGTVVRNNLIYSNSLNGIWISGASDQQLNPVVQSNTFYQTSGSAFRLDGSSANIRLRNNIFHVGAANAIHVASNSQAGFDSDYNLFYTTAAGTIGLWEYTPFSASISGLADWYYELGYDKNSRFADPNFVDIDGSDNVLGVVGNTDGGLDDNFSLALSSPAIDAGDPLAFYLAEPLNSGGRINLGHHGNTPSATASPQRLIQVLNPNGLERLETGISNTLSFRSFGLGLSNVVAAMAATDSVTSIGSFLSGRRYLTQGYISNNVTSNPINTSFATNPAPQDVYRSYAYEFSAAQGLEYSLPVPNGTFTLRLHFAETQGAPIGQRLMDIFVNGVLLQANYDIRTTAGGFDRAVVLELPATAAANSGLTINIRRSAGNTSYAALVSGIELTTAVAGGSANPTLNLALSTNSGGSYASIATNTPVDRFGLASFAFTPTAGQVTASATALISATSVQLPAISDVSDNAFFIVPNGPNYYVAVNGSNLNSGLSPLTPMASPAALISAYDLDPGNIVFVGQGTYRLFRSLAITSEDAGVRLEGPAIGIGALPLATFNRSNTSTNTSVVNVFANNIGFNNLRFSNGYNGINALNADDLTITNSWFDNNIYQSIDSDTSSERTSVIDSTIDGSFGRTIIAPYSGLGVLTNANSIRWGRSDLQFTSVGANQFALGGTNLNLNSSNSYAQYTLPFEFPFFGNTYSYIYVSSEGRIGWDYFEMFNENNSDAALEGSNFIAPLWDNLRTDQPGDGVFADDSVADQVTIRWNATTHAGGFDVQFSATLFADGRIQFNYGPGNTNLTPTIGIAGTRIGSSYGVNFEGASAQLLTSTIQNLSQTAVSMSSTNASIRNNSVSNFQTGLSISGTGHQITDNAVTDGATGINVSNSTPSLPTLISGNTITSQSSYGLLAYYAGVLLTDNEVAANAIGIYAYGSPIVRENLIHSNNTGVIITYGAAQIINNRIFNHSVNGIEISSYSASSVIEQNQIYSNSVGIRATSGVSSDFTQIRNNLIYSNSNAAIWLSNTYATGANPSITIINNTIFQEVGDGLRLDSSTSNVKVSNNMFHIESGSAISIAPDSELGFSSNYNLFHTLSAGRIATWEDVDFAITPDGLLDWFYAVGQDRNSQVDDPDFINPAGPDGILGFDGANDGGLDDNFGLLSTSPGIDAGNPDDLYLSEPLLSGGRINLGHQGNTPNAAPSAQRTIQVLTSNGLDRIEIGQSFTVTFRSFGLTQTNSVAALAATDSVQRIGNFTSGDRYLTQGYVSNNYTNNPINTAGVTNPAPAELYRSFVYDLSASQGIRYSLPVPNGTYTLRLHFAELQSAPLGSRLMDVLVNGVVRQANYDVRAVAGGLERAAILEISVTASGGTGINLELRRSAGNVSYSAILSGLELLASVAGGSASPTANLALSTNNGGSFASLAASVAIDRFGRGSFAFTPTLAQQVDTPLALFRVTSNQLPAFTDTSDSGSYIIPNGPNYYVSPLGSDRNSGLSPAFPMANPTALARIYDLDAGNIVFIESGDYRILTNFTLTNEDAGVRIEGPAQAQGALPSVRIDRGNRNNGAYVLEPNANAVTFANLWITGGDHGVQIDSADDVALSGLFIEGNDQYGVRSSSIAERVSISYSLLDGDYSSPVQTPYGISIEGPFSTVSNSVIRDHSYYSLLLYSHSHSISDNSFLDNSYGVNLSISTPGGQADTLFTRNTISGNGTDGVTASGTGLIVRGNAISNHTSSGLYASGAVMVEDNDVFLNRTGIYVGSGSPTIRNNRTYANTDNGISVGYYTSSLITANRSYSNSVGIRVESYYSTSTLTNNLVYANTNSGITVTNTVNGYPTSIINNTVYQEVGDAIRLDSNANGVRILNNILWVEAGSAIFVSTSAQTGLNSSYNLFQIGTDPRANVGTWNNITRVTLANWIAASAQDGSGTSLTGAANFIDPDGADSIMGYTANNGGYNGGSDDNFLLTGGSPAIDRASTFGSPLTDIDGYSRVDDPGVPNAGGGNYGTTQLGTNNFAATGVAQNWRSSNTYWQYNLPFNFNFYGVNYSSIYIASSGLIMLGSSNLTSSSANSTAQLTDGFRIAALWDNIDTSGAGDDIFINTATPGQVTIRWNATNRNAGLNNDVNFAVTLFTSGQIRFEYGPGNSGLSPTAGIGENATGRFLLAPSDNQSTLTNRNSILFSLQNGIVDIGASEFQGRTGDIAAPQLLSTNRAYINTNGATRTQYSSITLNFSESLNAIDASAAANYDIRTGGLNGIFGDGDDVLYPVVPSYTPNSTQVVLNFLTGAPPDGLYRMTVYGEPGRAVRDLAGNALDGDANGSAGGNWVRTFRIDRTAPIVTPQSITYTGPSAGYIDLLIADPNGVGLDVASALGTSLSSPNLAFTSPTNQGGGIFRFNFTGTVAPIGAIITFKPAGLRDTLGNLTSAFTFKVSNTSGPINSLKGPQSGNANGPS